MDDMKPQCELTRALGLITQIVKDGLEHGFFNYSIRGELVNGRKRRLTIEAGKSLQFTIPEEDLRR